MTQLATQDSLQRCLEQAQRSREERFTLCIARPLAAALSNLQLRNLLDQLCPMAHSRSIQLRRSRNGDWQATLHLRYRMGVRIADAYAGGALGTLSPEEQQTLGRALAMVHEAQMGAPGPADLARRLYDAVRQSAVYENPPVGTQAYGQVISAASVLLRGRANCQGFSDAFYLLGSLAGLAVGYRSAADGVPHLFNTLHLGALPFTVDATKGLFPGLQD